MPEPWFYLREDERVLARLKPVPGYTLALLLPPAVVLSVLAAAVLVARALVPQFPSFDVRFVFGVYAVLLLVAAFASWRRVATSEVALTDQRIYTRVGKLVTRVHFTTHDKVTDIHYRQGPLDRMLGVASLTFSTAGGDVGAWGVRDALGLKEQAEAARDAFIHRLLGEAPAPLAEAAAHAPAPGMVVGGGTAAAAVPLAPVPEWTGPRPDYLQAGDTPVWYAKPQPIAAIASLRSLVGLAAVLLFSRLLQGTQRGFVLLGALGLVLIFLAVRLAQLRRTEYVSTDRRVYARRGLVGTTVNQLTYDKITDITLHQDILGRLFGYASVTVQTAGSNQAPITMVGLSDALGAKSTIEQWRDRSLAEARR